MAQNAPDAAGGLTAAELEAVTQRILNVVGHELRTPMTTLRGLAEALVQADPDVARDEIGPAILRSTRRLESLLDDLLIAVGVTTVLPVGERQPANVEEAVLHAWQLMEPAEPLALEIDGDAWAHIDAKALERVLVNVFDNAVKYGREPPSVRVRSDGQWVEIDVDSPTDLVHPDEVGLVAEPFFRGYHAVTTSPGIGLGLTVARELVRQAGGRLEFSGEGDTALTRIILPCRPEPQ